MNNIIDCRLDSTCKEIYTGIWQHDYGQILRITGADLPKAVEVQFSLRDKGGDTLTRIGTTVDGVTEVKVPDSFLKNENCTQNYLIYAWIYVTDDASGNTEYQIILHVKSRPKPEEPTEEPLPEPNIFHETVKSVNAAADRAEAAEQKAKASATEAGKYAASASESATAAEKNKEDALRKVGEKKQKAIEAIQEQEETSVGKIIDHTDNEIQRIQNQTAGSKRELEQTIANASSSKEELDESIQTAGDTKTALDKSTELAGTAKTELDTSTQKAGEAKTALDGSARTAGEIQETLNATVKQAGALDNSLGEKIETGTQLKTDLTASGEKAVQDIQNAGSEQLGKMQTVAEEFTSDREQITTNKEDIGSLKEDLSQLSEEIANLPSGGSGLTAAQISALDGMFKVTAFSTDPVSAYAAFKEAFGIKESEGEGVPATAIVLDKTALSFADITTQTITANVTPSNSTDPVVWSTSDPDVATVSGGVVTPVADGSCTIIATAGSVSASCEVTVSISAAPPASVVEWEIGGINPQGTLSTNAARLRTTGFIPREYDSVSANDGYEIIVCCFRQDGGTATGYVYFNPNDNTVGGTGVYSSGPIDLAGIKAGTIGYNSNHSWFKILLRRTDGANMAVEEGENAVVFALPEVKYHADL